MIPWHLRVWCRYFRSIVMRSATQGRIGRGLPVSVTLAGEQAGIRSGAARQAVADRDWVDAPARCAVPAPVALTDHDHQFGLIVFSRAGVLWRGTAGVS